jgi:DNA sulfur modification protein DndD
MILDSIRIENFGAYGGLQEATLTSASDKAVILFGGMNGGGKTTLLDALQLVLYGPKAKVSNRGRMAYRDYLAECIHRGGDPGEGAGITLRFRRMIEGETRHFEVERSWRQGVKGIEETVHVLRDGEPDETLTAHWDEVIEAYLPVAISNLFFFDGEQIKELAEGDQTAAILGTAIRSLLGLDLVDRLEGDLRVFERKKRQEGLDPAAARELAVAQAELNEIDRQWEQSSLEIGRITNEAGRLGKDFREREERFRHEGGDLYLKRKELEAELAKLEAAKKEEEQKLRELAAGPLPLLLIDGLLGEVETQARHETSIRHNRLLVDAMEERDEALLEILRYEKLSAAAVKRVDKELAADRKWRLEEAGEDLILDADDHLAAHISHLRSKVLPEAGALAKQGIAAIRRLEESIARADAELGRVPEEDSIARFQEALTEARRAHATKMAELDSLKVRQEVLGKQREEAIKRIDRFGERDLDSKLAEDSRMRMLKHSAKVRETLAKFRTRVIERHVARMETLMLESFRALLRKNDLVHGLRIDPQSFEVTLSDRAGRILPFDRLSAGERQLLATAMLWGLARASGRPIPTIIDTPLGRLDSSHRKHLVERYFPFASHQVLLLSTDEEIVGSYHQSLKPFINRHYLLAHDETLGQTSIQEGYFQRHEATR